MIILSIDVGIKNLAVCCLNVDLQTKEIEIIDWNVYDLCNSEKKYCTHKTKKSKICNKLAKYIKNDTYCCKTHAKNTEFFIPTAEMSMKNLKKKRVSELYQLANNYNIQYDNKINKTDLLKLFDIHINEKYFDIIKPIKIDDIHMISIGRNINNIFNKQYSDMEIDLVLIENQISPIANKMKTIQGMIAQYFIMMSTCEIIFVSSINKLKLYEGCNNLTYKERKSKSVDICKSQITNNNYLNFFNESNKKDDLADSYLQGIWYIKTKIFN